MFEPVVTGATGKDAEPHAAPEVGAAGPDCAAAVGVAAVPNARAGFGQIRGCR